MKSNGLPKKYPKEYIDKTENISLFPPASLNHLNSYPRIISVVVVLTVAFIQHKSSFGIRGKKSDISSSVRSKTTCFS